MKKALWMSIVLGSLASTVGFGMYVSTDQSKIRNNNLAHLYNLNVNKKALEETATILHEKRKEAESSYYQDKTPENIGQISIIDLALNRIEDPSTTIYSFEYLTTAQEPEILLIKRILGPIVKSLSKEFSQKYMLTPTHLTSIQNIFFKQIISKNFENKFAIQDYHIVVGKKRLTPEQKLAVTAFKFAKEAANEPSIEAEEAYAQSLGEGSGRVYKHTFPQQPSTLKVPHYNPTPPSAIESLDQAEYFGIGYQ